MRKQQKVWEKEHRQALTIPSLAKEEPSSSVVLFVDYLHKLKVIPPLKIVDIGCGKGRNALYLAKLGFKVYGLDYINLALQQTRKLAVQNNVSHLMKLFRAEIDKHWSFPSNFFNLAVDCFSSIDIETYKGRLIYKKEMYRTLKPGGYALVTVVSADDQIEKEMIKKYPGPEINSTIWPDNGKFQKDYDEKELREFYKEFKIIEIIKIKQPAYKLGRNYTATNFWLLLQKPILL